MSKTATVPVGRARKEVAPQGHLAVVRFTDRTTRVISVPVGYNPHEELMRLNDPRADSPFTWVWAHQVRVRFNDKKKSWMDLVLPEDMSPVAVLKSLGDTRRHLGFTVEFSGAG